MQRTAAIAATVGLFGAAGSLLRWGLGSVLAARFAAGSFLPVLIINVVGCFAMGLLLAVLAEQGTARTPLGIGLTTGLLGGFTTYSAFAYQTWEQLEQRRTGAALANVGLTVVVCLAACAAGLTLGRWAR
jgi:CrcB protein